MARAKYYIKKQVEGEKIEELANFTRKDKAEQFLNGLFREYKKRYFLSTLGASRLF